MNNRPMMFLAGDDDEPRRKVKRVKKKQLVGRKTSKVIMWCLIGFAILVLTAIAFAVIHHELTIDPRSR